MYSPERLKGSTIRLTTLLVMMTMEQRGMKETKKKKTGKTNPSEKTRG